MARHRQAITQTVRAELTEVWVQPVERAVRTLVAVAVKAHGDDPPLHRVLAEQIPRVGPLEELEGFSRENYPLFAMYLERHREELQVDDLEPASFICVAAIEALTHNAVLHHAEVISSERMEAPIDEGACLVTGYLEG